MRQKIWKIGCTLLKNKIAIITIHNSDPKDLEKTLVSIDRQKIKPELNLVIIKKINNFNLRVYKKKYRRFIIGKDKSLWNAMNIGLKYTKNFNIIFLNSGDRFFSNRSLIYVKKNIDKQKKNVLIFKTALKYKKKTFFPKKNYFNSENYSPHPSFVRPPVKRKKITLFNEKNKINADGFWMRQNREQIGYKKINKILSIYYLGGRSSNPTIKSILQLLKYDIIGGLKEIIKYSLIKIFSQKNYYKIIYWSKFEIRN